MLLAIRVTIDAMARGTRTLRRILIVVLVLTVLLVGADRVGDYVAEQATADTIQTSQRLADTPDVGINGFPFLTQLATRSFDQITITADDVPIGRGRVGVTFDRIRLVLDDVTVTRDFSTVHAGHAFAVGTIAYRRLGDALGVELSYAGNGRVKASKQISILGREFRPTITAAPALVDGALSFGAAQLNGLGALAGQVSTVLDKVFDVKPPLNGIPFDIRVQKLSADAAGLQIDLVGADLTYRKQS